MSYDGTGNLYVGSLRGQKSAAWLPKGGSGFMRFQIEKEGSYGWDGRYFVIAGKSKGYAESLTLSKLHDGIGKATGHVSLDSCTSYYYHNFSIAGSDLVFACGFLETASLDYYRYPTGGKPIKSIFGVAGSVAISVGSSHLGTHR